LATALLERECEIESGEPVSPLCVQVELSGPTIAVDNSALCLPATNNHAIDRQQDY
jgi:hypothetical protein